jgi:hypothetical protein
MILSVVLVFFLKFAGIPSGADALITWVGLAGDISNISFGAFFIATLALFSVGVASGIAIGFITKSPTESYIIAPICAGIFVIIVSTFVSILTYTQSMGYVYYISMILFAPLLVGFFIAIIEFWRGTG